MEKLLDIIALLRFLVTYAPAIWWLSVVKDHHYGSYDPNLVESLFHVFLMVMPVIFLLADEEAQMRK